MDIPAFRRLPIISGWTARRVLDAGDGALAVSLDLGRSRCEVAVRSGALALPDGQTVPCEALADAFSDPADCLTIEGGKCRKVYHFSPSLRRYYKLYQPFEDRAPTIVINGATMHAIVGKDPWQDEAEKVEALPRAAGRCLDTCAGLGYSAQLLADAGYEAVTTCEADPNVLSVAAVNPWSEGLFVRPQLTIVNEDVREVLARTPDGGFTCVFHDPPTVFQAGEMYSAELYAEFARVLSVRGVLYHYVGEPGRRSGRDYARGVMRRLQAVGFSRVRRAPGGVIAQRGRGGATTAGSPPAGCSA